MTFSRRAPLALQLLTLGTALSCTFAFAAVRASNGEVIGGVETAVCTVVTKANFDASRPLQPGNPIESLAYLPAVCTSQVMSRADIRDGVRSLLSLGWRVVGASHQVTAVRTDATGMTDLLISAAFTIERTVHPVGAMR